MSGMIIATNIMAMNAHRNLNSVGGKNASASEKLSSGSRINRGADDAAGIAISKKLRAQVRGMQQAQKNAEDGINVCKTMDGGMDSIQEMMIRQRELIIQGMNDTNADSDKAKIQMEIDQLTEEIAAVANNTEFNKIKVLNRSGTGQSVPIYDTITTTEQIPVYKTEYRYTLDVISTQISHNVYDSPAVHLLTMFSLFLQTFHETFT